MEEAFEFIADGKRRRYRDPATGVCQTVTVVRPLWGEHSGHPDRAGKFGPGAHRRAVYVAQLPDGERREVAEAALLPLGTSETVGD